jgi:hypothetical protein
MTRPRTALVLIAACGALAAPSALAASAGTYKGKIRGGGNDVRVKVKNNRVVKFTASIYASCGLSNFNITVAYPPAGQAGKSAKISNGKFKAVFRGSPDVEDDRRTIKGTFNGSKVSGTIKVEGPCSSDGKYSAKR